MTCFFGVSNKWQMKNYLPRRYWYGIWIKNFTDFVVAWNATVCSSIRKLTRSSGFPGSWKWKGNASTLLWMYLSPCSLQQHPGQMKADCPEQGGSWRSKMIPNSWWSVRRLTLFPLVKTWHNELLEEDALAIYLLTCWEGYSLFGFILYTGAFPFNMIQWDSADFLSQFYNIMG